MPNPRRKHTPSRTGSRRASNWRISAPSNSVCTQCGESKLPHTVCKSCGFYNGELIVPKKEKKKDTKEGK